jgi:hypothetical protein
VASDPSGKSPRPALTRRRFMSGASSVALAGVAPSAVAAAAADPVAAATSEPSDSTAPVRSNSRRFIDVTLRDGRYVLKPLIRSARFDAGVAAENSRRIRAILRSSLIGPGCVIYFPAGDYYFDGADGDWDATIQTTHPMMTIRGDGLNGTILRQKSTSVAATIKVQHDRCAVSDLAITSADRSERFEADWSAHRHASAIHLASPEDTWHTDPQIERVAVNTEGNNIVLANFYRPFEHAIRVTGPWLNVYVHTAWLRDVRNGIHVVQGTRIAGPAKFIDVNCYATPPDKSSLWTRFFASETHFMEQVELIHCTFIGSQFIYMHGRPETPDGPYTPMYNMVIDHNYINCAWVPSPKGDYTFSGIYLSMPPARDGANHSRDIRFTNNSCTGGLPDRPAFFYLEGVCRGVTFADNDVSSGGMDKCVYIRGSEAFGDEDIAVRDIKVTGNYFRNYANPITIGGDRHDPSRPGTHDDPYFNDRVLISDNETQNEPAVERIGLTTCFVNRARQVTIRGNSFVATAHSAIVTRECEHLVIASNAVSALRDGDGFGILTRDCSDTVVSGNSATGFTHPVRVEGGSAVSVTGNVVAGGKATGVSVVGASSAGVVGNTLTGCEVGLVAERLDGGSIASNVVTSCRRGSALEQLDTVTIVGNTFDAPQQAPGGANTKLLIRSNNGLADRA